MRILITGTDGYIGCVLAPAVIDAGHEVVGLDTRYFDEALLGAPPLFGYPVIVKDLRDIAIADLDGIDAVMHLAGLSNDALGELSRRVPSSDRSPTSGRSSSAGPFARATCRSGTRRFSVAVAPRGASKPEKR